MADELIENSDFEPGPDLTLRQWARRINWAVTLASDCWGVEPDDRGAPTGWALYDMDEDDPPIAVFDFAEDALHVCDILREYAAQPDSS